MKDTLPKKPRLRLDPVSYRGLRQKVLERDGWRCQFCGSPTDLHVHHVKSRGQLGDDCDYNLITLCSTCHRKLHAN
jgi:5-methylcytosine-specific restriction endonuclease McrA